MTRERMRDHAAVKIGSQQELEGVTILPGSASRIAVDSETGQFMATLRQEGNAGLATEVANERRAVLAFA